ncbi:MAG: hypothetical protein MHM6MM_001063 [Cercozoa sp. M6MM]
MNPEIPLTWSHAAVSVCTMQLRELTELAAAWLQLPRLEGFLTKVTIRVAQPGRVLLPATSLRHTDTVEPGQENGATVVTRTVTTEGNGDDAVLWRETLHLTDQSLEVPAPRPGLNEPDDSSEHDRTLTTSNVDDCIAHMLSASVSVAVQHGHTNMKLFRADVRHALPDGEETVYVMCKRAPLTTQRKGELGVKSVAICHGNLHILGEALFAPM